MCETGRPELLRHHRGLLTCLEIDPDLARSLSERVGDGHVTVQVGDATRMPFRDGSFSVALSFTMLHHVSSTALQNCVLREAFRVLKPGVTLVGVDSIGSLRMRLFHLADTMVCVEQKQVAARLRSAGFKEVDVQQSGGRFRFRARKPASPDSRNGFENSQVQAEAHL